MQTIAAFSSIATYKWLADKLLWYPKCFASGSDNVGYYDYETRTWYVD